MNINEISTPAYVVDEKKLIENLSKLKDVQDRSGAKILLAEKAFSMYYAYPMIKKYLCGTTSSGLYEALLSHEEFGGENHVFCPAYTDEEMKQIVDMCDHIIFNSIAQFEYHRKYFEGKNINIGLRINPEFSTQEGHEIYDPCAKGSRLGIVRDMFPDMLPKGVNGIHFHTLCEQGSEPLVETFKAVEEKFGKYLKDIEWINLGGGHHITRDDYNVDALVELVKYIKETYGIEVYLEPGEAIALNAGYLYTKVLDIVYNGMPILILDTSAACHMPDVLEMPYRPPLRDRGMPGEKKYTCRLSSCTCLSGDVIGDYSFDKMPEIGDILVFEDMAIYSMVKNNTFNGMPLPDIDYMKTDGDVVLVKRFGYKDFKERLS